MTYALRAPIAGASPKVVVDPDAVRFIDAATSAESDSSITSCARILEAGRPMVKTGSRLFKLRRSRVRIPFAAVPDRYHSLENSWMISKALNKPISRLYSSVPLIDS